MEQEKITITITNNYKDKQDVYNRFVEVISNWLCNREEKLALAKELWLEKYVY